MGNGTRLEETGRKNVPKTYIKITCQVTLEGYIKIIQAKGCVGQCALCNG